MDKPDLVGIAEIAERVGLTRAAVANWPQRKTVPPFPEPLYRFRCGPIWDWDNQVAPWLAEREPKPRRNEVAELRSEVERLRELVEGKR